MKKRWIAAALVFCMFMGAADGNPMIAFASEPMAIVEQTAKSEAADFVIEDGVLTDYTGAGGEVIIPETVTSITTGAFYGNNDIVSVYIPDTVTSIEREAFRFCTGLRSVRLPAGLTTIPIGIFEYSTRVGDVQIPETVTEIGANAFVECHELKNIVIPQSVTRIGAEAFSGIENLETITIPETVTYIGTNAVTTKDAVIIGKAGSAAQTFAEKGNLSFVEAGTEASLTIQTAGNGSVTVKKDGQEVSSGAVLHTGDEITISTAHSEQGQIVRANGKDLTSTKIKLNGWSSNTQIVSENILTERSYVITEDTLLDVQFLSIPSIDSALNTAESSLHFTVEGEEPFETAVFAGRTVMQSMNRTKGSTSIKTTAEGPGYFTFDYLSWNNYGNSFRLLVDGEMVSSFSSVPEWTTEGYMLEDGTHEIAWIYESTGENKGAWLDGVQVITDSSKIPVQGISLDKGYLDLRIGETGQLVFSILPQQATGKEIHWSSSDEQVAVVQDGTVTGTGNGKAVITAEAEGFTASCTVYVTKYELNGDFEMDGTVVKAYYGDSAKVVLPEGTTAIDAYVFQNHEEITEIDFGDAVTAIGAYAFSGCTGIESLTLPDTVTEIGRNAFTYCENLETLVIGNGVTELPHFAFFGDVKLQTAAIPATVTEIDTYAFSKTDGIILYCEKDSAAYTYALYRGFHYCLVEGEILGESFDFAPYEVISGEEAVSEDFQGMLSREIVVDADTEYTYYLSGTKLYRQDVARNIFDAECVYDTQDGTVYSWYVGGSVIYLASTASGSTTIKGYDVNKSREVFSQTFPVAIYSSQFVVDGEQNFYFVQNSKDLFIYGRDGEQKDSKILSDAAFLNGMSSISLVNASRNNRVVFADYYSSGRALSYTEEFSFTSLSDAMTYPNYTRYYEGYQLVRNGQFIDTSYWIKNPKRCIASKWRFFADEKYAVNQYGEIAAFDWNAEKEDSFDFEILYQVNKGQDYSVNASAYLDGNLYVYGSNGNIIKYDAEAQEIKGHYELGDAVEIKQLYTADRQVYVRYEKDGVSYMAPLETAAFAAKTQVIRSDHVTRTYGKEQVAEAYKGSLPAAPYTTEASHYKVTPSAVAPYSAGALSDAVIADTLKRLNYARWQSGLNTLSLKTEYMERSQKGAVLMKATDELTHYPFQPGDMDDDFYQEGYAGVNADVDYSGNVSWGDSLVESIFGYLDDVNNVEPNIGHRLSLLDKKADAVSFGFCGYYSALSMYYAQETPENNETYYAWPSAGYFPSEGIDTGAKWHIITDWFRNHGLKVTFETGQNTYETNEIYYDSSYNAFYFAPPQELVDELKNGGRRFADGKTVQVTLTGLEDNLGNDIIVTYPVTFVSVAGDDGTSDENGGTGGNGTTGGNDSQGSNGNQGGNDSQGGTGNQGENGSQEGTGTEDARITNLKITAENRPYGAKTLYAKKGSAIQLKADVSGNGAFEKGVIWQSSNETVASVSASGKVKIRAAKGTAVITAVSMADSSKSVSITVKAVSKNTKNKALTLKKKKITFKQKGETAQIQIKKYTKKTTEKLSYKVKTGKKYVSVDKYGVVTCKAAPGKKVRTATIQVSCGSRKAILKVSIPKK